MSGELSFDAATCAEVQHYFWRILERLDARGLLGPGRSDDEAFTAMAKAAEEDQEIAASLAAMADKPSLYLYIRLPSLDEETSRQLREQLVDESLPIDPEPAEEVLAILRTMNPPCKEQADTDQQDSRKIGMVQRFVESESLMMQESEQLLSQLLQGLAEREG